MVWLPDGKKFLMICLFVLTEFTNVTDTHTHTHTQTDRRIPNDDIARACIASRGKNEYAVFGLDGDGECRRPTVGDYAEPNV